MEIYLNILKGAFFFSSFIYIFILVISPFAFIAIFDFIAFKFRLNFFFIGGNNKYIFHTIHFKCQRYPIKTYLKINMSKKDVTRFVHITS